MNPELKILLNDLACWCGGGEDEKTAARIRKQIRIFEKTGDRAALMNFLLHQARNEFELITWDGEHADRCLIGLVQFILSISGSYTTPGLVIGQIAPSSN